MDYNAVSRPLPDPGWLETLVRVADNWPGRSSTLPRTRLQQTSPQRQSANDDCKIVLLRTAADSTLFEYGFAAMCINQDLYGQTAALRYYYSHMYAFISWSGTRSHALAEALRDWLPLIMNEVKPFLSSADIEKGAHWSSEITSKLELSEIGIICVTPASLHSDWLLFEAGALAKKLDNRVCPLLVDLDKSDVTGPLSQLQMTLATKEDIKKLVMTINSALGEKALGENIIAKQFSKWWPDLEEKIEHLPKEVGAPKEPRTDRELLEEILALAREHGRQSNKQGGVIEGELQLQRINRLKDLTSYLDTWLQGQSDVVDAKDFRVDSKVENVTARVVMKDGRTRTVRIGRDSSLLEEEPTIKFI